MPEIRSVVNTRLNGKFNPKPKNTFTSSYLSYCSFIWAAGFWDMSCRDVSSFSTRFVYQIVFKNSFETKAVIELWCASGTRFCPTLHLSNKDNTTITAPLRSDGPFVQLMESRTRTGRQPQPGGSYTNVGKRTEPGLFMSRTADEGMRCRWGRVDQEDS